METDAINFLALLVGKLKEAYPKVDPHPIGEPIEWTEKVLYFYAIKINEALEGHYVKGSKTLKLKVSGGTLVRIFNYDYDINSHGNRLNKLDALACFLGYENWVMFKYKNTLRYLDLQRIELEICHRLQSEFKYMRGQVLPPDLEEFYNLPAAGVNPQIHGVDPFFFEQIVYAQELGATLLRSFYPLLLQIENDYGLSIRTHDNKSTLFAIKGNVEGYSEQEIYVHVWVCYKLYLYSMKTMEFTDTANLFIKHRYKAELINDEHWYIDEPSEEAVDYIFVKTPLLEQLNPRKNSDNNELLYMLSKAVSDFRQNMSNLPALFE